MKNSFPYAKDWFLQPQRRVLDVKTKQLTLCGTHIGFIERWQPAEEREQHDPMELRMVTKEIDNIARSIVDVLLQQYICTVMLRLRQHSKRDERG